MKSMRSILRGCLCKGAAIVATLSLWTPSALAKPKEEDDGPQSLIGKPAPELAFTSYASNIPVNLADLRGKMVVVDFFMAEKKIDATGFDDVLDVEKEDAKKGVVIVGVSMDLNTAPLMTLFQQRPDIDWPIEHDGMGFGSQTALRWKASRQTGALSYMSYGRLDYLVSPDGTVLWAGAPAELGRAIDDQIKDHKPQLVSTGVMADAKNALDKMQAAITADKIGEAYRQRRRIPDQAMSDDDFAAEVKDADDKLKSTGDAALAEVDPLIASKDYSLAVSKLKDLANGADGTPLAVQARSKLAELQKNPDARAALQAAEKNAHADDALRIAQTLQANKNDVAAYSRYKFIVKTFAGTSAAQTASDAIAAYDADPDFKKKIAGTAAPSAGGESPASAAPAPSQPDPARAKSLLSLANSYRDAGDNDKAREKYQAVITQFPGTPEADTAKDELSKLSQ
jgi:tetratricopeptide (TPR) repeat protein